MKDRIREQQMAAESQAEETLKELEQEIAELKRRGAELERLSQEDDHIHYLQVTSPALCSIVELPQ